MEYSCETFAWNLEKLMVRLVSRLVKRMQCAEDIIYFDNYLTLKHDCVKMLFFNFASIGTSVCFCNLNVK